MSNKKIEKNDVVVLRNLQNQYNDFLIEAGQIYLTQIELDKARSDFERRLSEFRSSEQEIIKRMNQKYGEGTIDLEKEEFIFA